MGFLNFQQTNLTLKVASAQVVETSFANGSPCQDSNRPDDLFQSRRSLHCVISLAFSYWHFLHMCDLENCRASRFQKDWLEAITPDADPFPTSVPTNLLLESSSPILELLWVRHSNQALTNCISEQGLFPDISPFFFTNLQAPNFH